MAGSKIAYIAFFIMVIILFYNVKYDGTRNNPNK